MAFEVETRNVHGRVTSVGSAAHHTLSIDRRGRCDRGDSELDAPRSGREACGPANHRRPERTARGVLAVFEGAASWCGRDFQGRLTASGERFDMNDLTAAHRTLRFGTRVRVTNLSNGREVVVRVNDRGPYSGGRVIDVSREAAVRLEMIEAGVAPVRVEVLGE
ncbi:MAG: septal ring lytic transglycosylase RlpA family protein [Myxococcales bacterium]|nr:septal ring lytic transglycosylase RlpA family protein [Myxococcales bacterium]